MTSDDQRMDDWEPLALSDDAQTRFYLDNWKTIETWANLRNAANAFMDGLMFDVADVIAADAQDREDGTEIAKSAAREGRDRSVALRRSEWPTRGLQLVSVGLGWTENVIAGRLEHPYIGIHVLEPGAEPDLRESLRRLARQLHSNKSAWVRGVGERWPVYLYVAPRSEPFNEANFARECRTTFWSCWSLLADEIDRLKI